MSLPAWSKLAEYAAERMRKRDVRFRGGPRCEHDNANVKITRGVARDVELHSASLATPARTRKAIKLIGLAGRLCRIRSTGFATASGIPLINKTRVIKKRDNINTFSERWDSRASARFRHRTFRIGVSERRRGSLPHRRSPFEKYQARCTGDNSQRFRRDMTSVKITRRRTDGEVARAIMQIARDACYMRRQTRWCAHYRTVPR